MNYLQKKKLAFISIVNSVKRFVRSVTGVPPLALEDCVDEDSLIDYKIYGNSVQNGTPTPEAPVEVQSIGEKTVNLFDKSADKINGFASKTLDSNGNIIINGGSSTGNYISANFVIPNWESLIGKTLTISGSWIASDLNKGAIRIQYNRGGAAVGTVFGVLGNSGEVKTTSVITVPPQDGDILCVYIYANTNGTMSENATVIYSNIQIEEGSTATPYEPYGYKIPVTARGKNLVDIPYINANTNSTIINCNLTETIIVSVNAESVEVLKTIWRISFKYKDGTLAYFVDGNVKKTIQSSKENPIIEICYRGQYITAGSYNNIMIEYGTTATDYEPYYAPITTNLYLDEPLRSQYHSREKQWYYDKVDYKTETIIRNLAEKTFIGADNEKWTRRANESDTKIMFFITGIKNNTSFAPDNVMCDKFVASYVYASNIDTDFEGVSLAYTTDTLYIGLSKSRLTDAGLTVDLDGFKTWLSQNPVTITYILKEPTEETISIPKLPTIKGTTIYETGTSINASNMEATYYSTSEGG